MDWTAEALLADTDWLQRLARRLVADGAAADDLVQDTWVLALDRRERPSRAWLGAVAQKLSFTRKRSEARRGERQRRAARREAGPDASDALARVEAQRLLADAILALDEPYRTALVLRYTNELSTAEIAEHTGAAIGTVHSWLKRGLERLRADLERRRGKDPNGWLAALAPLAGLRRVAPEAAAAGAGWATKGAVAAVLGALLIGLGSRVNDASPLDPEMEIVVADRAVVPSLSNLDEELVTRVDSEPLQRQAVGEVPEPAQLPTSWSLGLTVNRPGGAPAAGAEAILLVYTADVLTPHSLGTTNDQGRIETPLEALDAMGWASVSASAIAFAVEHGDYPVEVVDFDLEPVWAPGRLEQSVTLSDEPRLTGRVVGPDGQALVGVNCAAYAFESASLPAGASEGRGTRTSYGTTGPSGRFALEPVEGRVGYVIVYSDAGDFAGESIELFPARDLGEIRVEALAVLRGRVVDPDGRPARAIGIEVRSAGENVHAQRADGSPIPGKRFWQGATDADGRFVATGLRYGANTVNVSIGDDGAKRLRVDLPCPDVELTVDRPRLLVRVRDTEGRLQKGVEVAVTQVDAPEGVQPARAWLSPWGPLAADSLAVTPGASYSLMVAGRGGASSERIVHMPHGVQEHEVELLVGHAAPPPCDLQVIVTAPDGVPVSDFEVSLLSCPSEVYLDGMENLEPESGGWLRGVPAGRYVASLWIGHREANARGLYLPERRREIELTPQGDNHVVFEARPGARLSIHLDVTDWPLDAGATPTPSDPSYRAFLEEFGAVVQLGTIEPERPLASPMPDLRRLLRDPQTPGRQGLTDAWMPGQTASHWTVEAPGRYPLRVESQRWKTVDKEIVLRAGETTEVRVALSPR